MPGVFQTAQQWWFNDPLPLAQKLGVIFLALTIVTPISALVVIMFNSRG